MSTPIPIDYNPVVRQYAAGPTFCVEHKGLYIHSDGVPRGNSNYGTDNTYKTVDEAQRVLDIYNNKGTTMSNKVQLRTGMRATLRDGTVCLVIQVDTNFKIVANGFGMSLKDNYKCNGDKNKDVMEFHAGYDHDMFLDVTSKGRSCWRRQEHTTMTIAEIEKALGVSNLKLTK